MSFKSYKLDETIEGKAKEREMTVNQYINYLMDLTDRAERRIDEFERTSSNVILLAERVDLLFDFISTMNEEQARQLNELSKLIARK